MTTFALRFTATPAAPGRPGTRNWSVPRKSRVSWSTTVTHGRVPGRDAELRLSAEPGRVRVDVSDTRGERLPVARDAGGEEDGGRGLVLVAALAKEWGVTSRAGAPGKTVWAVVPTECGARTGP